MEKLRETTMKREIIIKIGYEEFSCEWLADTSMGDNGFYLSADMLEELFDEIKLKTIQMVEECSEK